MMKMQSLLRALAIRFSNKPKTAGIRWTVAEE